MTPVIRNKAKQRRSALAGLQGRLSHIEEPDDSNLRRTFPAASMWLLAHHVCEEVNFIKAIGANKLHSCAVSRSADRSRKG